MNQLANDTDADSFTSRMNRHHTVKMNAFPIFFGYDFKFGMLDEKAFAAKSRTAASVWNWTRNGPEYTTISLAAGASIPI